ncbi:RNA-guided endonuclease InsQ/TnpB family protein [Actinomadura sp. 6N118]|uniref:RNA-guided endonuclease InsQ/TnpB family protein n=1 Tax=Actinomadura sp. 6N118 TaxID=3375151 RepID=UPI0037B6B668
MKLVVQVKLLPSSEQAAALAATLRTVNALADQVSAQAFEWFGLKPRERALRGVAYGELKDAGLGAQAAQHVIKRVVDAYSSLRGLIDAGVLGGPQARRRRKAESKPITFRSDAAHTYDDRCLSWQVDARTVSIWTTAGRVRGVAFTGSAADLKALAEHRQGESDLVCRDGVFYLLAVCEIPEKPLNAEPADWVGVDRGINNLATTSDGGNYQGRRLQRYRRWQARKRAELQAKKEQGSRSAARRLAKRKQRESRHATQQNHVISKGIVAVAERTGRGIALEQLSGIRERVRLSRDQRATQSSWPFHQLGAFIAYKAHRAGVPFLEVDPAYTSQSCPRCGHVSRKNRPTRDLFCCRRCGLAGPADEVAAVNIRNRARTAWVFVNMPVPHPAGQTRKTRVHARKVKGDAPRHDSQPRREARQGVHGQSPKLSRSRPRS